MLYELINAIVKQGWILTVAGICMGLYINAMVRDRADDKDQARRDVIETANREKLQKVLETILATEHEILESIKANSVSIMGLSLTLKEFHETASDERQDVQADVTSVIQEMKLISSNQITSAAGLQRIIEQLINAIKD